MAASRLPPELIQEFIDNLHDDVPSLKACSLVCKAWTHLARLLLFSWTNLRWPLQPSVFPFVRHLRIFIPDMDMRPINGAPPWDQIFPLLIGFRRIVSLTICLSGQPLDSITHQMWLTMGNNFSGVVSLSLAGFSFADAFLTQAICVFPCLQELCITSVLRSTSTQAELPPATTFRLPPNLHTLKLNTVRISAILELLLSLSARPALRTVCLRKVEDEDLPIFHQFIGAFGNDLESITLYAYLEPYHLIDVTPLTHLRSIRFVFRSGYRVSYNRWIMHVLSHMSSVHLGDVVFQLHPIDKTGDSHISNALDWSEVDAILQRSTFSQLRNVELRHGTMPWYFGPTPERQPFPAQVIQCLSRCRARGVLLG